MEYTLSDYRAATQNGNGWNDGLTAGIGGFLGSAFGNGGFGFGGGYNAGGRVATTEDLASGFNFAGVNNKLNELTAGVSGINQNIGNAICTSTYELTEKIGNCCCNTQLGIKDLMATVVAEGAATRNLIQENKIEGLQQQLTAMQINQAVCGIPKINPNAWGVYPYTCGVNACGCTNI